MLARKRFAREAIGQPVRDQDRRERSEIGGWDVADRMARFLVHHQGTQGALFDAEGNERTGVTIKMLVLPRAADVQRHWRRQ
jgi:hypothetical protein